MIVEKVNFLCFYCTYCETLVGNQEPTLNLDFQPKSLSNFCQINNHFYKDFEKCKMKLLYRHQ